MTRIPDGTCSASKKYQLSPKENQFETRSLVALRWLAILLSIVFSFLAAKAAPQRQEEVAYA